MASLDNFDASQVAPTEGFDVLPAGEYRACIVESTRERTKKGDGELLKFTLQILQGQHQNRKVFERINLYNPNPEAQRIGQGTLSAICRAVGVLTPSDTTELHNRPMRIKLKVRKGDGNYSDSNEVVSYKPDGQPAPAAAPNQAQPAQPAAEAPASPAAAWAR